MAAEGWCRKLLPLHQRVYLAPRAGRHFRPPDWHALLPVQTPTGMQDADIALEPLRDERADTAPPERDKPPNSPQRGLNIRNRF